MPERSAKRDVGAQRAVPLRETESLADGYRMTELGPLPEEWRVVKLGEVANIGHRSQKRLFQVQVPFIPMALIPEDGLYLDKWEKRAPQDVRSGVLVKNGDLLLAKITPCLENGKQGIVRNLPIGWGYATTEVFPIYPEDQQLLLEFLAYYLKVENVRQDLASKMEGTTGRQRLPKAVLREYSIPLPPLPEQRAIAHVLRTVQEAKEATERVIAALRELKKSLMRHLFTYGPVPLDQTEAVELQETEIGPLPTHWRVVRLEEVFDIQQGKALSRKKDKGLRPRPFLRTANVFWGRLDLSNLDQMDFSEEEEKKYALRPGDLLVCEGGDVGRTAIWEGQLKDVYYQNHLHRLRAKSQDVEPRFVMYWMQTAMTLLGLYLGTSNKTTIPNLSRSRLASFAIPLPPLPEQQEIARMLQAVDARIEAEEKKKAALEALFKTLLHHLMTAKVRVPEEFVARFAEVLP